MDNAREIAIVRLKNTMEKKKKKKKKKPKEMWDLALGHPCLDGVCQKIHVSDYDLLAWVIHALMESVREYMFLTMIF